MHSRSRLSIGLLVAMVVVGCGPPSAQGPLGPPNPSEILAPFAGKWAFDLEKTLAARQAAGESEQYIAELREQYADDPDLVAMHEDLTFDGNLAMGGGPSHCEYRFFRMHKHGAATCGRAWHHEDRSDPGDMSKCYVRLDLTADTLRLDVFMEEGLSIAGDPDLVGRPPVDGDAAECDVEAKTKNKPKEWLIYVFRRGE